jgi:hypothetical protein
VARAALQALDRIEIEQLVHAAVLHGLGEDRSGALIGLGEALRLVERDPFVGQAGRTLDALALRVEAHLIEIHDPIRPQLEQHLRLERADEMRDGAARTLLRIEHDDQLRVAYHAERALLQ